MKFLVTLVFFSLLSRVPAVQIPKLRSYVKDNPDDLKAVNALAVELYREQQYSESLKYWRYLARKRPRESSIRFSYAKTLYDSGAVTEALIQCFQLMDTSLGKRCDSMHSDAQSDYPDAYGFFEARKAFAEKDYDQAQTLLEELLLMDVYHPDYRLLQGHLYRIEKKFDLAWDQYSFVIRNDGNQETAQRMKQELSRVGEKSYQYVNAHKAAIEDEATFYERFYLAQKLYPAETNRRLRGFRQDAVDYFSERMQSAEAEAYELWYRIGSIHAAAGSIDLAIEAFESAMDYAPDDLSYASLEFLMTEASEREDAEKGVEDLIEMAGGEDVYAAIMKASEEADRRRQEALARGESVASLPSAKGAASNINKEEFIAEFENYKRRYQAASSQAEKQRLKAELESKYGHLARDPAARAQMQKYMKSAEGQSLQKKYGSQMQKYKDKIP